MDGWVRLIFSALLFTSFTALYLLFTGLAGAFSSVLGLGKTRWLCMYISEDSFFMNVTTYLEMDGWDGDGGG
jgi:hypothetical protein